MPRCRIDPRRQTLAKCQERQEEHQEIVLVITKISKMGVVVPRCGNPADSDPRSSPVMRNNLCPTYLWRRARDERKGYRSIHNLFLTIGNDADKLS